jgi:hypothetical protein
MHAVEQAPNYNNFLIVIILPVFVSSPHSLG